VQSFKEVKRPGAVTTLETKLKIRADFEAGKREISIGREMKKARIQTTSDSFSRRRMIHSPQLLHLKFKK
jgi:hypothetical protein